MNTASSLQQHRKWLLRQSNKTWTKLFKRRITPQQSKKAKNITEKVVESFAWNNQPISMVKNADLSPSFGALALLSQYYISDTTFVELCSKVHDNTQIDLNHDVTAADSFTTDIGSSEKIN